MSYWICGLGITNLVERATVSAAELAPEEFRSGARLLEEGGAVRAALGGVCGHRRLRCGLPPARSAGGAQVETMAGSRVWVLPSTSGLNAHYKPAEFAAAFRELREAAEADLLG